MIIVSTKLVYVELTEKVMLVAFLLISSWMLVMYALVGTVGMGVKHTTGNAVAIGVIIEDDGVFIVWLGFGYFS